MEIYEYLFGSYLAAWVIGFSIGWKFRIFKQATEQLS